VESKLATKETDAHISFLAIVMKANTHEILLSNFARRQHMPGSSVIPVALASSVICVVTRSQE
jgi:hypothetical protein